MTTRKGVGDCGERGRIEKSASRTRRTSVEREIDITRETGAREGSTWVRRKERERAGTEQVE